MFRLLAVLACLVVLTAPAIASSSGAAVLASDGVAATDDGVAATSYELATESDAHPAFVAVYPNPVADGDVGEFVSLSVPPDTDLGPYMLSDGERRVDLPNRTAGGRVVVTDAPRRVRALLDVPGSSTRPDEAVEIVGVDRGLDLSNGGERVRLMRGNRSVAVVRYGSAPEGEQYDAATGRWKPLGLTDFPIFQAGPADVEAFVLPDAPAVPIETIGSADERLYLAGYTLTSDRVADALVAAHRRGVDVRVLVEGAPVGGISHRQGRTLDRLTRAGVPVRVLHGPAVRYAYHHAKYAVVDDSALVLTENWKPSGTGGRSSRGWGAVVRDPSVANRLATVFRADAEWRDSLAWSEFRAGRRFQPSPAANASFDASFEPDVVHAQSSELVVAPDNAGGRLRGLVRNASASVRVIQVSIDRSFARTLVEAARRGVEVRVLLAGAWYVREDNQALADWLDQRADEEDLPLAARVAVPSGYEKIHAKGLLVDDDAVALGSLNWNEHSATENREVVVVLHGEEPAAYYGDVFAHDWDASAPGQRAGGSGERGAPGELPGDLFAVVGLAAVLALVAARRIDFGHYDGDVFGAEPSHLTVDPGRDTRRPDARRPDARRPDARRPDARRPDARRPDAPGNTPIAHRSGERMRAPPGHQLRGEQSDRASKGDDLDTRRDDTANDGASSAEDGVGVAASRDGSAVGRQPATDEPDHRLGKW